MGVAPCQEKEVPMNAVLRRRLERAPRVYDFHLSPSHRLRLQREALKL